MSNYKFQIIALIAIYSIGVSSTAIKAESQDERTRYKLGPGDKITVKLFQAESLNSSVTILPDGTVSLPRIKTMNIEGLNLDEARIKIEQAYKVVLKRPVAYIDLIQTRPLRVSVTGEVQTPGIYSLGKGESYNLKEANNEGNFISSEGWPSLVEAIQKAGGITAEGNLRRVTLTRKVNSDKKPITREINYWDALKTGDVVENPLIYDGDSIRIPKATKQTENELLLVARSSFAPKSINVQVTGEVANPGLQKIKSNMPLSQAIITAGGLINRSNKKNISMIRLNSDGTISKRTIRYEPGAKINSINNPVLREGDTIVVNRNNWTKTTDLIKQAVEPLGPLINSASIFRMLSN